MRRTRERGAAVVTLLTGLVVLGIVAFAAFYFISDPFRTRADEAYRQFSEWTPENIAEDPVGYLDFCERQAESALETLRASEISIAQQKGELEQMRSTAVKKARLGARHLSELKELYRAASAAAAWPVSWQGRELDEAALKRQIVTLDREVRGQEALAGRIDEALKRLELQRERIAVQRAQATEQLTEIRVRRETLKVEQVGADLTDQLVTLRGAVEATVAAAGQTPDEGVVRLDDLAAAEAAPEVDEQEFARIMDED